MGIPSPSNTGLILSVTSSTGPSANNVVARSPAPTTQMSYHPALLNLRTSSGPSAETIVTLASGLSLMVRENT